MIASGEPSIARYCVPVIHGCLFSRRCSINGKFFRWTIIARRSVFRAGVRYFRRGCDDAGHCANFVETEQIVEYAGMLSSFVQTRGSIPLFWTQLPNGRDRKPDPQVETNRNHVEGYTRHFQEQKELYGEQVTNTAQSFKSSVINIFFY